MSLLKDAQRSYNQFRLDITAVYSDAVRREVAHLPEFDPFRVNFEDHLFFDTAQWSECADRFLRYFSFNLVMKGGDMIALLERETQAFAKELVKDLSNSYEIKHASWEIQGIK